MDIGDRRLSHAGPGAAQPRAAVSDATPQARETRPRIAASACFNAGSDAWMRMLPTTDLIASGRRVTGDGLETRR